MRAALAWLVYPILLIGGAALGWVGLARGYSVAVVVGGIGVGAMIVVALLERGLPYLADWNRARGDVGPDALHLLVSNTGVSQLVNISLLAAIAHAAPALSRAIGAPLWPHAAPLAVQVAIALVAGELCVYWMHRLLHERARLWPLHVVHHSPDRLYWLNGFRSHPLDAILQYTASQLPLVLLGASTEVIALAAVIGSVQTPLQHSNIALRTGPLCYVLSVAELHRWHHAPGSAANVNYGTVLSLWDLVFGTFRRPPTQCQQVGVDEPVPRSYLGQLLVPFREVRPRAPGAFSDDADSRRT